MISFDITKEQFIDLYQNARCPAIIQLMCEIDTSCTPLQLYESVKDSDYSYLLESVEKEKKRARYSFVGFEPEMVISIKNRNIYVNELRSSSLTKTLTSNIMSISKFSDDIEEKNVFEILNGIDVLKALSHIFPKSNDTDFLNFKTFDRQTFLGGAIGYNSYDIVYDCWLDREKRVQESTNPDMQYAISSKTFIFDHVADKSYIVLTPFLTTNDDPEKIYDSAISEAEKLYQLAKSAENINLTDIPQPQIAGSPKCSIDQDEYMNMVEIAKEHIINGDIFQVVLSRKYSFPYNEKPVKLYHRLRNINPSPYMYLFKFKELSIVGASPETLLTVHNRKIIINPIAGTCPRGQNEVEDKKYAEKMICDEKERAEHTMLVDLGRNDVRMVSKPGTVDVEELMSVIKYSHVQHIESTVTGILRDECDQFDATRATFPAGTLSGAPKIRAMEIIDELEQSSRGVYGGGVGYYSWNGDADFAIVIRTVVIDGNIATVQAGAGIVADSIPENEYIETERKMGAMLQTIGADTL